MLSEEQKRQLLGLCLLVLGVFLVLSIVPPGVFGGAGRQLFPSGNVMGPLGAVFRRIGAGLFGAGLVPAVVPPILAGAACFRWITAGAAARWSAFLLGLAFLLPSVLWLLTPPAGLIAGGLLRESVAGWVGSTIAFPLVALLNWVGAGLVLLALLVGLVIATVGWEPLVVAVRAIGVRRRAEAPEPVLDQEVAEPAVLSLPAPVVRPPVRRPPPEPAPVRTVVEAGGEEPADRPPVSLLSLPPARDPSLSEGELDRLGDVLMRTLRTFKVEGQIVGRTTGPVVTQFEVVPAPGIKVNRIAALDADLALALKAPSVRIVAPIPGKGAVGVDVPNPEPEVVYLREILESHAYQRGRGQLPLALGKDLTGRPYVADLARMPHLLIAGATGSGKSVCINTIITSLIYRYPPELLRLLLIDPKMVELSMYGALPHLRHPVVTDPHEAGMVLKWAVYEMEHRYALLSENGARSIVEFNRRVGEGQVMRRAEPVGAEDDPDRWIYKDGPLPYIVLVVDELADLIMTVQAEIEKPLAQLAQKARAIGIHLIVATQRPSVNVITGLIKANFPCRIAFRVSSKVDSRTILDQNGADALLGNGDMLFLPPGQSDPVRIQGAFLSTEDTERLMAWYRERERERGVVEDDILEVVRSREAEAAEEAADDLFQEERDKLFMEAAEICINAGQGSTSLLQRRLRIGYGRAARIIDQLHRAGILGPPDGSKPREVLVGLEALGGLAARLED